MQIALANTHAILETEQNNIKAIAEKARDKTLFIDNQTNISGNYVATGALEVGSQNGARAGITGVGLSGNDVRFYAGSDFANRNNAPFRVLDNGNFYAENAHIKGRIEATEGRIGGFQINSSADTKLVANGLQLESGGHIRSLGNGNNAHSTFFVVNNPNHLKNDLHRSYVAQIQSSAFDGKMHGGVDIYVTGANPSGINIRSYSGIGNPARAIHIEEGIITGRHAVLETPYIGHAYWGVIEEHLHLTNTFIFTSAPNHHQSVVLPNSGKIQSIAGSDQVSFELRIIVAHACQQRIRIEGQNGGFLLNNNAERANSSNGHLDMARGDTLILRRYASDYYIMSHRD